ncbi:MAG: hypothetical protein WC882_01645 [Candidatus Gracilibacteria bacterium]
MPTILKGKSHKITFVSIILVMLILITGILFLKFHSTEKENAILPTENNTTPPEEIINTQTPSPASIEEYYSLLSYQYLPELEIFGKPSDVEFIDEENYYIKFRDTVEGEKTTSGAMAIFIKPDGTNVIAVEGGTCTETCNRNFWLLEYNEGEWIDVTAELLQENNYEPTEKENYTGTFYFEIPQYGTSLTVYNYYYDAEINSAYSVKETQLDWINGKFQPSDIFSLRIHEQGQHFNFILDIPTSWGNVDWVAERAGFYGPEGMPENDPYNFAVGSELYTIVIEKASSVDEAIFSITSVDASDKNNSAITGVTYLTEHNGKVYFYSGYDAEDQIYLKDIPAILDSIRFEPTPMYDEY